MNTSTRRLIWVTNIPTPYRAELWLELRRLVDLEVLCMAATEPNRHWDGEAMLREAGAGSVNAHRMRLGDTCLYLPTRDLLRSVRRDNSVVVIDGWESPAYMAAMRSAHKAGNPVITSYHSTFRSHRFARGPIARARKAALQSADLVMTVGPTSTRTVVDMGISADRVKETFTSVPVKEFAETAQTTAEVSGPGHRFLYVGQLIDRKNVHSLISAFAGCRNTDDRLTIVGEGPKREELQAKARSVDDGGIEFVGNLEGATLRQAYATHHTLVLPSTEEVYGLVVAEGLASGCHAVVSTACGIAETVQSMPGVYLADPTAASMAMVMSQSRDDWRGRVSDPPILALTARALAELVVDQAMHLRRTR